MPKRENRQHKIRDFIVQVLISFGVALLAGAVVSYSVNQGSYWIFLNTGLAFLITGSYYKFAKISTRVQQTNNVFFLVTFGLIFLSQFFSSWFILTLLIFVFSYYFFKKEFGGPVAIIFT